MTPASQAQKLTKAQIECMTRMTDMGSIYPGKRCGNASTFAALVRRGYALKHGIYGPFSITRAGRAALTSGGAKDGEPAGAGE